MELTDLKALRALLERHHFTVSKSFSQNFIINPGICPKIAQLGGCDFDTGILEIGPGVGVLTRELCRRSKKVVSIELDDRLPPILSETMAEFQNFHLVSGDVLKIDLHALMAREFPDMPVRVCANLPYAITSPILERLLERNLPVLSVTVMVQKEVARRICKTPPDRDVSPLSIACLYYAQPRLLFDVSRGSFFPAPAVDSSVIRLDLRETPPVSPLDPPFFFKTVHLLFSQRRKTILNTLSTGFSLEKPLLRELLLHAAVSPEKRPEQLTLEEFCAIANTLFANEIR